MTEIDNGGAEFPNFGTVTINDVGCGRPASQESSGTIKTLRMPVEPKLRTQKDCMMTVSSRPWWSHAQSSCGAHDALKAYCKRAQLGKTLRLDACPHIVA